ncbi:hypothetical protein IAR55_002478 [Kwoniella newhampshirensis]|uniref:Protein PNS1 n=1 Tax=Kwoniella newhampshirensis TaxID=1651941 RepID=A0AAW0Z0S5_9TREE
MSDKDLKRLSNAETFVGGHEPLPSSLEVPREDRQPHPEEEAAQSKQPKPSFWSRCHDRWALVLFLLSVLIYTVLSVYTIYCFVTDYKDETDTSLRLPMNGTATVDYNEALNIQSAWMFAGATGIAIALSLGLLLFVRHFPSVVIYIAPSVAVIYMVGSSVGCFMMHQPAFGIISALVAALVILAMIKNNGRIELAKDLMITANLAASKHWSVFWTVIAGLIVQGLNTLWNVFTFVTVFLRFEPWQKQCAQGVYCSGLITWILLIFVVLEYIWISGVINNVTLAVMAGGPYSNWWYGTDSKTKSESVWALKKAAGTSLGSIAFGSLLVVFVEIIHFILKTLTGGDSSVERFKIGYIQGGREIFRLFGKGRSLKNKGLGALLNDSIVGSSLTFACLGNAILCAGFTYLYMTAIDGTMKIDHWWDWLILLYSFLIGISIGLVLTSAIEAGVSTIFVCMDKDPGKLKDHNPQFYAKFGPGGRYQDYNVDIYPELKDAPVFNESARAKGDNQVANVYLNQ